MLEQVWEDSPHVGHLKAHPQQYHDCVQYLLEQAVVEWDKRKARLVQGVGAESQVPGHEQQCAIDDVNSNGDRDTGAGGGDSTASHNIVIMHGNSAGYTRSNFGMVSSCTRSTDPAKPHADSGFCVGLDSSRAAEQGDKIHWNGAWFAAAARPGGVNSSSESSKTTTGNPTDAGAAGMVSMQPTAGMMQSNRCSNCHLSSPPGCQSAGVGHQHPGLKPCQHHSCSPAHQVPADKLAHSTKNDCRCSSTATPLLTLGATAAADSAAGNSNSCGGCGHCRCHGSECSCSEVAVAACGAVDCTGATALSHTLRCMHRDVMVRQMTQALGSSSHDAQYDSSCVGVGVSRSGKSGTDCGHVAATSRSGGVPAPAGLQGGNGSSKGTEGGSSMFSLGHLGRTFAKLRSKL